jgi:hypothetical protein
MGEVVVVVGLIVTVIGAVIAIVKLWWERKDRQRQAAERQHSEALERQETLEIARKAEEADHPHVEVFDLADMRREVAEVERVRPMPAPSASASYRRYRAGPLLFIGISLLVIVVAVLAVIAR